MLKVPPSTEDELKNDFIIQNHNLIYGFLNQKGIKIDDFNEYYDIAAIGLIQAARKFDNTKGINFSCYAYATMENELNKEWRKENRDKRLPEKNIASFENLDENVVREYKNIEDEIIDKINGEEIINILKKFISHIKKPKHKIIMELCLMHPNQYTLIEIGKIVDISPSYISQIKTKYLIKLRDVLKNNFEC